ncbi:hypothetical protein FHR24_001184 [Wenyingzhuangia heitensis]|uniref:DUF4270 domain-containing protein n=1 Tax=Wenyingzhuangia heitensis TaxID=1487859 RepID=A0ABX0U7B3_9FLAO|nr:DUF4270 family protein [Wenyingzhuangia heitensis]NIJ44745.1 hypothetical protein [Wenyingzhuangia heitensis]
MKFLVIGVLGLLSLISCSSEELSNYTVGSDFVETDINIIEIDTFKINAGTYKMDSIGTSSTGRILIGNVDDEYLGTITAQSYFQLQNATFTLDDKAVYDSIGFVLNYDQYYFADTTKTQTYKIHRVLETVEPIEDDVFFNTSKLSFDTESIGELTFVPKMRKDTLYIPMQTSLGEELFNKIDEDEFKNLDDFLQYFKGLTIAPDTTVSSSILGFNFTSSGNTENNSSMRLYYSVPDPGGNERVSHYLEFYISSIEKQFNAITTDFSTAKINGFTDVETIIPTTDSDGLFYSQAGTGISARIEIPHLRNLNQLAESGTVLDAQLKFYPKRGSYTKETLPQSLAVYVVDHKNRILNTLTNEEGGTALAILNAQNDEFENNTYYSVDLKGFLAQVLNASEDFKYALMVQFSNLTNKVDKVVIEDKDNVELSVKYLNY